MLVKKNAFWPFEFDKSLSIIYLPTSIFKTCMCHIRTLMFLFKFVFRYNQML